MHIYVTIKEKFRQLYLKTIELAIKSICFYKIVKNGKR